MKKRLKVPFWFVALAITAFSLLSFWAVLNTQSTLNKAKSLLDGDIKGVYIDVTRTHGLSANFQRIIKEYISSPSEKKKKELSRWVSIFESRIPLFLPDKFAINLPQDIVPELQKEVLLLEQTLSKLKKLITHSENDVKTIQEYADLIDSSVAYLYTNISNSDQQMRNSLRIALTNLVVAIFVLSSFFLVSILAVILFVVHIRKQNRQLENLSLTDTLTKLGNRRKFNQIYDALFENSIRNKSGLSLLITDVDNFKKYNDTYGHHDGDEVLLKVASAIKATLKRSSDDCFRLGGEEFGCLVVADSQEELVATANRIRSSIQELSIPHKLNEHFEVVTVSIGCASLHADNDNTLKEMYIAADQMLYTAKEEGRNRIAN